jgi:predicted nucleic acid-binding protein
VSFLLASAPLTSRHHVQGCQSTLSARLIAAVSQTHPRSGLDTIIAAIAATNECVVVTDNERDFRGIDIFNPIRSV